MTRRSEVGIDLVAHDMASREIGNVGGSLDSLGGHAQNVGRHFGLLGSVASGVFNGVFLGVGMMAVQKLSSGLMSIPNTVIGMNASLEKSTLQFTTLFGGGADAADRAREHVRMLFDFAKATPFETQPVINASRTLQTFGGDALNTAANLTMIGDAAAGASADINEVSFWVGRAYAAIQGGQPFGEARMRLQELALLSPKAAQEMERLQKSGASANEVWAVMQGELGKMNGAMKLQAESWTGLTSTLSDTVKLTMADAFKPFFDMAKEGLKALIALFSNPAFSTGLKAIASGTVEAMQGFGRAMSPIIDGLGMLLGFVKDVWAALNPQAINGVYVPMQDFGVAVNTVAGYLRTAIDMFGEMVDAARPFVDDVLAALNPLLEILSANLSTIGLVAVNYFIGPIGAVIAVFESLQSGVENVGSALATFEQTALASMGALVEQIVPVLADLGGKFVDWLLPMIPVMLDNLFTFITSMLGFLIDHLPDIVSKLAEWGVALVGWLLPRIPQLLGNLLTFVGKMVWWIFDVGIPKLVTATKEMAGRMLSGLMDKFTGADGGKGLIGGLNDVIVQLQGAVIRWANDLTGGAIKMAGDFVRGFINGLASLPGKLRDAIAAAFRSIDINIGPFHVSGKTGVTIDGPNIDLNNLHIPGLAVGAWQLPADMLAMVHKDEMVLPADIATRLRAASGGTPSTGFRLPAAGGGGGAVVINQTFNFGQGSVRGDDDIRRLGQEMQDRAQLQGFTATVRQVGRATV